MLGQGEMGQHPTSKGFCLQDKWDKEINALYMLGEGCARKSLPLGRAEGFLARNSSWEGAAGAASGVQELLGGALQAEV